MKDSIYLEYQDSYNNSDKFWAAEIDGRNVTVNYGRRGSTGQAKTKAFLTDDLARRYYDQKVREKLGKGYVEPASAPNRRVVPGSGRVTMTPIDDEPPVTDAEMDAARSRLEALEASLAGDE